MKARNLYKTKKGDNGVTFTYVGMNNIILSNEMKKQGYLTNVWVSLNQLKGKGYCYGKLKHLYGDTVSIEKFDFNKEEHVPLWLVNIDQTDFPQRFKKEYQHFVDQDAGLYYRFQIERELEEEQKRFEAKHPTLASAMNVMHRCAAML